MGYESYLRKQRMSVFRLFACKVVDVFSFHLEIFHWHGADISRSQLMRESNTSTYLEEYGTQKAKVERKIGKYVILECC
jgi:hypothetical protein